MGLFPSNFVTADLTVEPEMSKYFLVYHWTVILNSLKFSFLEQEFSNVRASKVFIKNTIPQSVYQAVDFYLGKKKYVRVYLFVIAEMQIKFCRI